MTPTFTVYRDLVPMQQLVMMVVSSPVLV